MGVFLWMEAPLRHSNTLAVKIPSEALEAAPVNDFETLKRTVLCERAITASSPQRSRLRIVQTAAPATRSILHWLDPAAWIDPKVWRESDLPTHSVQS